ncbi:MAG TPA: M56 family metallopeptidase [Puia sp.]|nr:M56 family metallopeptidase [Puia sp.]
MHLIQEQVMRAICWTLIHSVWQGLLLAVLAGLVIMFTKKSTPAFRYNLLSFVFFLFLAASCATFTVQYGNLPYSYYGNTQPIAGTNTIANTNAYTLFKSPAQKTYFAIFTAYFNEHASLVVLIWFVIMSAQGIRLLSNAIYSQRIRYYKTHAAPKYWTERMHFLAKKLEIKQRIGLLQSEIAKAPMVTGFFKPVILFPFSLMCQLPPQQVEAVLLHELAHIKRKDCFVNMLQSFAEIIFFFNPGVRWVSSLIKEERENCCDDIAINETKQKKDFVHALVSFQEFNLSGSPYALAFPGQKKHLLNRVKRILTNNNKTLNNMEKITLASGIVIISLITIAFRQMPQEHENKSIYANNTRQENGAVADTIPDDTSLKATITYDMVMDGKKYKITEANGKVTELFVEGTRIPDDKIKDYQEIIDRFHVYQKKQQDEMLEQNALMEKQKAELIAKEEQFKKEQDELLEENNKKNYEEDILKSKAEQEEMKAKMNMETSKEQQELLEQPDKYNRDMKLQLEKQNAELMALSGDLKKRQDEMISELKVLQHKEYIRQNEILKKQIVELKREQLRIQEQRIKIDKLLGEKNNVLSSGSVPIEGSPETITVDNPVTLEYVPTPPAVPEVFESHPLTDIINDLANAGVISSQEDLEFTLNNKIFRVNGKQQSEEFYARMKEKYLKSPKDHVIYSRHGHSISGDISIKN